MLKMKVNKDQTAAMQMETTSFSIVTDSDLDRCTEVDIHKSHTKLCQLIHYQELDLVIERKGNDVESVSGPFDLVRWEDLNLVQATVQRAIVKANLFNPEEIRTQLSIVRQQNRKWNLICTLWLDSPKVDAGKLDRAQSVGTEVIRELGTDTRNPTESFCFEQLIKTDRDAVRDVVYETLCQSGGHSLKKQMAILIGDQILVTLKGRMGPKPDRKHYASESVVLEGKCRGFVNDHKQHALLFSPNGGNAVEIGFVERDLQKASINLAEIAVLNRQKVECKVNTNKTTDPGGKIVYEFVSMEAANDAQSPPDLFAPELDDNKNNVIETSITNSNES